MIRCAPYVVFTCDIDSCNDRLFVTEHSAINYLRSRYKDKKLRDKDGWYGINLVEAYPGGYIKVLAEIVKPKYKLAYEENGLQLLDI